MVGHLRWRLVNLGLVTIGFYILAWLSSDDEQWNFSRYFSYFNTWAAAGLVSLLIWYEVAPWPGWIAVSWMIEALLLAAVMDYMTRRQKPGALQFSWQSYLMLVVRVVLVNLLVDQTWHNMSLRLVSVGIVLAVIYVMAPLSRLIEFSIPNHLANLYTWLASALVMTLVWYEMQAHQAVSVVIVWTLFAVVLFEIVMNRPSLHLRLQSYVALGASFVRIWFANLNAVQAPCTPY